VGKWINSAISWSLTVIFVLGAAAGGIGCGVKQPAEPTPPPAAEPEPAAPTAVAEPEPAETAPAAPAEDEAPADPAIPDAELSAMFQEAQNLFQLGQETLAGDLTSVEGREILANSAELYLRVLDITDDPSMRSEALLNYITMKDYFARNCRDVDNDIPGAIAHYSDIVEAIGDGINSQKQFYHMVTAELLRFELGDDAAARAHYQAALDYCGTIEPGNFSSCTDWEMLQLRYALDQIGREADGENWGGFPTQTVSLPNRDFENYYLLAAGLLDSAEMDPAVWTKETGYTDAFYTEATNRKTILDVLLINCFHGETLAASDPVLGDGLRELNFQRLLEQFPGHPATMMMLVKHSVHTRKMLRPEEADSYAAMAEQLATRLDITLIVDEDAPPVQEFLRRQYPADEQAEPAEGEGAAAPAP